MEKLPKHSDMEPANWPGYTIDELRYRRAYMLARCEIAKARLMHDAGQARESIPGMGARNGIMGKILGSLSYIDYAVIAFRIGTKLFKLTRHRK